ncbi:MAG: DUF3794 domain-containing protein [Clostridiaceae bacterium]|jgi:hypothetical protein|nr:DUF3794 domain-containing protein [Clostridiaceae bacterium]
MSLELMKEAVRLNRPIGEDSTQTIVENDIIVPDIKPDIAHILLLDGDAWISGAETAAGKVLINGTVRYKILYVSDDPDQPVKSITTSTGFQYPMDIPETRQGMQCSVKCDIEHMEYEILNSRKVNVKAIVSLFAKVSEQQEQYVTRDFDGSDGIQVQKSPITINSYIGDGKEECPVREIVDIPAGKPAILEILRNDVKISGREYKAGDDKIIVKGELNVSTLYIGDDESRSLQFMEHEIPFVQLIDMPGADESCSCDVDITLGEVSFEADEDSDGELRKLKCEADLGIYAQSYGRKDIEIVDDAYNPNSRVSIEKEQLVFEELVYEDESQITLKENIELEQDAPDISELFNIVGKLTLSSSEITDDRITVEGAAICNVLYLADNGEKPVYCVEQEIPFRQVLDAKGIRAGMSLDVEMDIDHYSYSILNSRDVEVRLLIGLKSRVGKQLTVPVIVRATEQPPDDKRFERQSSVTIYFTQPEDTLWKIAKRYYTTVSELVSSNGIDENEALVPGSQIIIMKKA